MGTGFLFKRSMRDARLASAVALAALIAATLPAGQARAATKGASAQCHGVVGTSPNTAILPASNLTATPAITANAGMTLSFTNSTPAAALPAKGKTSAVSGSFYLTVDQACQVTGGSTQTPCAHGGNFTGTVDSLGNMTLDYSDPAGTSPPVFAGCRQVFLEQPMEKNSGAAFVTTSLYSQTPKGTAKGAPTPPTCGLVSARVILSCTANNI